ncbi:MAG: hypothetical protein ABSG74_10570 [Candidatus Bathyarchaeia archaeon]|jgi:DNA-directed RNA polymerase subunit M/transcription elongation factor TFIIS
MTGEVSKEEWVPPQPRTMKITCANCGEEAIVPVLQFCRDCHLMLQRRRRDEQKQVASDRIKKETEDSKHKTVVFDRHWLDKPDKENAKT